MPGQTKKGSEQNGYKMPICRISTGVNMETMGLPCSHQLEKWLTSTGRLISLPCGHWLTEISTDFLTIQNEVFDDWHIIPSRTRVAKDVRERTQEPQIRHARLARSRPSASSHTRNTGLFGTGREAARPELITESLETTGSQVSQLSSYTFSQIARRNGEPPA